MEDQKIPISRQVPASSDSGSQSRPTVAVVVPVYNGSRYLHEALCSVLQQSVRPDELIVVDDGSTDDSVAIAKGFAEVCLIEQKNAGVCISRNRGVAQSTAEWIAFLDQDDLWLPAKLEEQLRVVAEQPECDLVVTGKFDYVQETGSEHFVQGKAVLPPTRNIGRRIYGSLRFVPSCVMVRRATLQRAGGFDPASSPCEDWDLWIRLEQAGVEFAACAKALVLYRLHSNNYSNNGRRMYEGELRVFRRHIAPHIAAPLRPFRSLAAKSRFMAGLALMQREQNQPYLGCMLLSLFWWPVGYWKRYKVAAHMLFTSMKRSPRPAA